jgi:hypothetical protein
MQRYHVERGQLRAPTPQKSFGRSPKIVVRMLNQGCRLPRDGGLIVRDRVERTMVNRQANAFTRPGQRFAGCKDYQGNLAIVIHTFVLYIALGLSRLFSPLSIALSLQVRFASWTIVTSPPTLSRTVLFCGFDSLNLANFFFLYLQRDSLEDSSSSFILLPFFTGICGLSGLSFLFYE